MKKFIKNIVGIIVVLLVLLIGLIVSLPVTIGPIVRKGAATAAPRVLGVEMSIGDVKLKPLAGQLMISDLKIGNPEGYSDKDAFAVKTVDINLKTATLFKGDTIHITKILIEDPAISYETVGNVSNFDKMMAKAQSAEKKEESEKPRADARKKPKKKVIIDEFVLNGSKVSYASKITFGKPITLPLPPVSVRDIGKESGGASMVEAVSQVITRVVGGLKDAITKLATGSAGALKDIGKGATDAVGDVSKGATDAAEKVTKDAADAVGGAAKAAEDKVKDASKKLKGIFGK